VNVFCLRGGPAKSKVGAGQYSFTTAVSMVRLAATYWLRTLAGVLLALLVADVLAPARATASCGDYVMVQGYSGHNTPHSRPAAKPGRSVPDPEPVEAPCRGPNCSGSPAPLSLPISTTTPDRHDQLDGLFAVATPPRFDSHALPQEEESCRLIHHVAPIFHPPRSA
jgi:hypothetical protein